MAAVKVATLDLIELLIALICDCSKSKCGLNLELRLTCDTEDGKDTRVTGCSFLGLDGGGGRPRSSRFVTNCPSVSGAGVILKRGRLVRDIWPGSTGLSMIFLPIYAILLPKST